jgi:hypothetical protein
MEKKVVFSPRLLLGILLKDIDVSDSMTASEIYTYGRGYSEFVVLAIKPAEDFDSFVRFMNLCRKSGRLGAAQPTLDGLVESGAHKVSE